MRKLQRKSGTTIVSAWLPWVLSGSGTTLVRMSDGALTRVIREKNCLWLTSERVGQVTVGRLEWDHRRPSPPWRRRPGRVSAKPIPAIGHLDVRYGDVVRPRATTSLLARSIEPEAPHGRPSG